jgi:hypothetical protein
VLTGDWWAEAGVLSLTTLAVGATVTGLAALLGYAGVGLGALLIVFLGNSFSGASSAPRMLTEPAGTLGQWLPPGAGTTLLRSVSYFDGAAALGPAVVLTWWAALGLGAILLGPCSSGPPRRAPQRPPSRHRLRRTEPHDPTTQTGRAPPLQRTGAHGP